MAQCEGTSQKHDAIPPTEQFEKIVLETHGNSWWSLSSEDSVFIVIGGIALAWASIQAIWESFARVCAITPAVASE